MSATNAKFSLFIKAGLVTALSLSALSFSGITQANDVERLVLSLCESAKSDDRSSMRKKLTEFKIRLRNIYSDIQCGPDGSLLRIATANGALEAATFITTKIDKAALTTPEADGKTIIQFSQELVANGDASKQAFVDLYNSKL